MEKEQSIEKRALYGSIANGLSFIFTFSQSVVLVPIFLNIWGKEKYGVWIALYSFVTLIKTVDAGHQNFIGNEINKIYHSDIAKVRQLIGSSFRVAYLLGLAELLLGCLIFYFFGRSLLGFDHQSPADYNGLFWANFSLLFVWFLFGSVGGILARILITIGKFSRFTYWGIAMKILETLVLLLAAFSNLSIFTTALMLAISSLLYYTIQFIDMKSQTSKLYPWWKYGNFELGLKNLGKAQLLTLTGFIDQFSNSFQIISVSNFLGAKFLPVFSTLKTLTNIALQVVNIFSTPLNIDIIKFFILKEHQKLKEIFSIIWLISLVFIYIPFVLLTPFVEHIYKFWTHNLLEFDRNLYYLLALSVCIYSFGTPFRLLLFGVNHLKSLFVISLSRLVILCTILLGIKSLGLVMVGLSVLVSEIAASIIIPYFFIEKELKSMGSSLDKKTVLISLLPLVSVGLFFYVLEKKVLFSGSSFIVIAVFLSMLLTLLFLHWKALDLITKKKVKESFTSRLKIRTRN